MQPHSDSRQLVAIMFTDVVGYTAITESDEAAALRVREQHRELVRTLVHQFDGESIDSTGDESLSIFPSALRAVDCALALQGALRSYPDLRLRIGIHLGDVLRRDGEVVGEGVNVAARIRPLAEPGGICVSEPVYQMVKSRARVTAHPLGPQVFKNVSDPLPVYALSVAASQEGSVRPKGHRRLWVGIAAVALLGVATLWWERTAILTWVAIHAPPLLATPIEQQVAFTETPSGVRIAYASTGSGPAIVWVLGWATHLEGGFGSPLYDPEDLIRMSSADHLFVRYDGRGFGLSDRKVDDFSLDARIEDLEAVVDALGLERFALYGLSAGGPTTIAYAARNPDRVTRLVLASTEASSAWRKPEDQSQLGRLLDLIETDWRLPSVTNLIVDLISSEADEVTRRVLGEFLRRSGDGRAVAGFLRAFGALDVTAEARRIRTPTLVVHAREDQVIGLEAGSRLASLIPGARFEIVEGGHQEGIGNTPLVRARILEFLAE